MKRTLSRPAREAVTTIAILGVVAAGGLVVMAIGGLFPRMEEARAARVYADLKALTNAAEMYRTRTGRVPETTEGIPELVRTLSLKEIPIDPWGYPYTYALVDGAPVFKSFGADRAPGGEGEDADITNCDFLSATCR